MIGATQVRSARALPGIGQRELARMSGLSLPTIQRMEASKNLMRGNADSLTNLVTAFHGAGIAFVAPSAASMQGCRGVQFSKRQGGDRTGPTRRLDAIRARVA